MPEKARLVVMASGHGSNLQAILDACQENRLPAEVVAVVSDHGSSFAMERAAAARISALHHPWRPYAESGKDRRVYDADLADLVAAFNPDLIVLAGWMRILSMPFLDRFPMRVINLHPALPGTFPGSHAIERAWKAFQDGRISQTGVMVHFVPDEGVDDGPVITSQVVPIEPSDSLATLEERIHQIEHRLLIDAIASTINLLGQQERPQDPMPNNRRG